MLQIRFHRKFKSNEDTLLIAGTQHDIKNLKQFFIQWDGKKIDLIKFINAQESIYLHGVDLLELDNNSQESTIKAYDKKLFFYISLEDRTILIGLLDGLLKTNHPGHQYVDVKGRIQLMISKDEYPLPHQ